MILAAIAIALQPPPEAALQRLVDRLQTSSSVSGAVVVEQNGSVRRYEFRLGRPRAYRVVGKDREFYCDGRKRYEYSPHLGEFRSADQMAYARVSPPFLRGFEAFYDPKNLGYRASSLARTPKGDVLTLEMDDGGVPLTVTLASDGLPLAWEREATSARYEGVQAAGAGAPLPAWRPPPGSVDATPRAGGALQPGEVAPDFTVRRLGGGFLRLATEVSKRKAVLLQFWHVDCPPCRESLPVVQGLVDRFASQGFGAVALNRSDPIEAVVRLFTLQRLSLTVGLRAHDGGLIEKYRVPGSPTFFLVGPDRKILATRIGYRPGELEADLAKAGFK